MGAPFAGIAVAVLAALVAVSLKRAPPDFAMLPVIATVRGADQAPRWVIRVAPVAHQIAVDCVGVAPPPEGRAYQLWLASPEGPRSLGLLPASGRKIIAEIPALTARLAGAGELVVTLEAARGAETPQPRGPVLDRVAFPGSGPDAG
jgi:anti-sigma-K factor RskA